MKSSLKNRSWVAMTVLLIGLSGCAATSTRQSTGEYIDDAAITTKVKSDLVANQDVSGLRIHVKTVNGVVYLTGSTETRQEANKAAEIAKDVAGVKAVENNIQIK